MQYTSKVALLAVALFGASAVAAPFGGDEYDIEAREVDNDLAAREYYDLMDAREYQDYLEAREGAASAVAVCLTI